MKILPENEFMALLQGLNFWTLKQRIKDATAQRASTIQLLYRVDLYADLSTTDRLYLQTIRDAKKQQAWIRSHGKLTKTTGFMKSHSFTLQFQQIMIDALWSRVEQTVSVNPTNTTASVRDTTNTLRQLVAATAQAYNNIPCANAPVATVAYGILAGTGATAPASTDYNIQTLIAQGSGSGQLQYQATTVGSSGIVGANVDTIIARVIVNGSAGTITITEIGLVIQMTDSGNNWRNFLVIHDSVSQAVNAGTVAIVSYDIRTTV